MLTWTSLRWVLVPRHRLINLASASRLPGIEPAPRGLDGGAVLPRPQAEPAHGIEQGMAELRELVIDARWNGREDGAGHEAVALQAPDRQGQHPLRDAAERAAQLVEPHRPLPQGGDDQHRPFVADPREHLADRAAILGHLEVTRYQACAFLPLPTGHLSSLGIKP